MAAYVRKTKDIWEFYSYINGTWEYETTEDNKESMRINKKAYKENSPYPLKVVKKREKIVKKFEDLSDDEEIELMTKWFITLSSEDFKFYRDLKNTEARKRELKKFYNSTIK